jgi:DNA polymerase elongation subunit (family B)|tara:strand:- start:3022 stop:3936 length:915 start_codon:yes stop_codon:yes gene_type:complete
MKVVYGHTDSIYVQIDSVEKAQEAIKEIEASVREHFPNVLGLNEHPVVLEFEKYYNALGVGTVKNRNAGMITWEDGNWLDEPKFTMTGFIAKRVSETKMAKEVQTKTLQMWANQQPMEKINAYLHRTYVSVLNGNYDFTKLIKRTRLKEARFSVKCPDCGRKYALKDLLNVRVCGQNEGKNGIHKCGERVSVFTTLEDKKPTIGSGVAGVINAWQNTDIEFDDSYLFLKVKNSGMTYVNPLTKEKKPAEFISGRVFADFKDYTPDWEHYAQQVVDKAKPVYEAMGWDLSSIRTGRIQKSLEEWF